MLKTILKIAAKIATYALAVVTVLSGVSGHIPPALWATPSILALAFPYLALLTLIAAIAWGVGRKIVPTCVCALALIAVSGNFFTNFPLHGPSKAREGEKQFTLLTYNVMHGEEARPDNDPGYNRTMTYVASCGADIVALQELQSLQGWEIPHLTQGLTDSICHAYPYRIFRGSPLQSATFSKYPMTFLRSTTYFMLTAVSLPGGRTVKVMNVHLSSYKLSAEESAVMSKVRGPRSARNSVNEFRGRIEGKLKEAFRARAEAAAEVRSAIDTIAGPLIVCGDFNDVPGSWAYRTMRADDLNDAYTDTGLGMMTTYNLNGFYFHIDQILYRPDPLRALSVKKEGPDSSDHFPLFCTFAY